MNKQLAEQTKLTMTDYQLIDVLNNIGSTQLKKDLVGTLKRLPLGDYAILQDLVTYSLNNNEIELDTEMLDLKGKKRVLSTFSNEDISKELHRRINVTKR